LFTLFLLVLSSCKKDKGIEKESYISFNLNDFPKKVSGDDKVFGTYSPSVKGIRNYDRPDTAKYFTLSIGGQVNDTTIILFTCTNFKGIGEYPIRSSMYLVDDSFDAIYSSDIRYNSSFTRSGMIKITSFTETQVEGLFEFTQSNKSEKNNFMEGRFKLKVKKSDGTPLMPLNLPKGN